MPGYRGDLVTALTTADRGPPSAQRGELRPLAAGLVAAELVAAEMFARGAHLGAG
jgi:hypothetical protein